jgi:hypothetical protein
MDAYFRDFNPTINRTLQPLTVFPGSSVLKLLLVLYGATVAPKLPPYVLKWFEHVPVRLFVIFLIVWTSNYDPALALAVTIVFYSAFNALAGKKPFETYEPQE